MNELPLVLLLLLVIAIILRMDIIFYVVYVLAGVYALARWWTARSLKSLRVTRRFTDHIFLGESSTVHVDIENRGWLPAPWVFYEESSAPALIGSGRLTHALTLPPKGKAELSYELAGHKRGFYPVGPGRIVTGDLFGFGDLHTAVEEPRRFVVYPRVIPLGRPAFESRAPHGTLPSRQPIFADPARVNGVRPYQRGDPVRSIDWKTSARANELHVKKVEPSVSLTTVLFLDLFAPAYSRAWRYDAPEWAIVVAASLANYLIELRQDVGLSSNGRDSASGETCWSTGARAGRTHLMKMLEWLARVETAESKALTEWLPQATLSLSWGATVIAITPSGDESTAAALHRLRRAGLNPVLLAVEPHARFHVVQERCRRLGIAAHQVANEADLRRWQASASGVVGQGLSGGRGR